MPMKSVWVCLSLRVQTSWKQTTAVAVDPTLVQLCEAESLARKANMRVITVWGCLSPREQISWDKTSAIAFSLAMVNPLGRRTCC